MATFHSPFFKIAVLNQLLEAGKLRPFFKELEKKCLQWQKAQIKARQDALHPDLLSYINEFEISEKDLNEITLISFEGGNEIYQLLWREWDGEDDLFLTRDFRDVALLPNLEEIREVVLCKIEDATPLLALTKLKKLDIDFGYGITDKATVEKLKVRGVEILSEEIIENNQDRDASAKEHMFVDNFNHAYDLLWEDDNAEEALEILEDLLRQKPDDFDCWLEKGNALGTLERMDEAEQAWLKCYQLEPENVTVNYNLANALLDKDDFQNALQYIETAIQNGLDSAEAYHIKALALGYLDNKTISQEFFELALKLYKNDLEEEENDETLFQIACVCNSLGNTKDALSYLKKSISLNKSNARRARHDKDFKSLLKNDEFLKITK